MQKKETQKTIDNIKSPYLQNIAVSEIELPIMPTFSDSSKIISLAENIRKVGLLHPISVFVENSNDQNKFNYSLLCGYRRLAAFKLLERQTIPAQIITSRNTADSLMLCEYCTAEHSDRYFTSDLLSYMISKRNYSASELAVLLGVSEKQIRSSLRLSLLSAEDRRKAIHIPIDLVMKAAEIDDPSSRSAVIDYLHKYKDNIRMPRRIFPGTSIKRACNLGLIENSIKKLVDQIGSAGIRVNCTREAKDSELTYRICISE